MKLMVLEELLTLKPLVLQKQLEYQLSKQPGHIRPYALLITALQKNINPELLLGTEYNIIGDVIN